jgi:outer membrane protein OmpA-like peptidoglycan-associated protein
LPKILLPFALLFAALLLPTSVSAQLEANLNAQRFQPVPGYHSFTTVDTARLLPKLGLGFDLTFSYARRPVQISGDGLARQFGLIDGLVGGHFRVGFAPIDWAEINLHFPFMQLTQVGALQGVNGNRVHYQIGDLEIAGRIRLLREEVAVGIAVIPFVSAPTGNKDLLSTRGTFTFGARVAVSRHFNRLHFGAYAGYRFVPGSTRDLNFSVDDELMYGAGFGVTIIPAWLQANVEIGGVGIIGPDRWNNNADGVAKGAIHSPLEMNLNARVMTPVGLDFIIGGGPGLSPAPGTPQFRVFFTVAWSPPLDVTDDDPDRDRIRGDADACPNEAEDKDGFEDSDGCPDPDNDGDGILDVDEPDCRDDPEDMDGFEDEDGCPDLDNDQDGIPDLKDQCPDEAEDRDGFEDTDGCPDLDNDGDGILDDKDICPDQPEDFNGIKDEDGCPDEIQTVVTKEKIVILDRVLFDLDLATIMKESDSILAAVAKVLQDNPQITRVRVEGYTDSQGTDEHNQKLSEDRARAVVSWLVKRGGVDASRLEIKGFGESQFLDQTETEAAHAKNRRVEFKIVSEE